jgi:hypothetical protein
MLDDVPTSSACGLSGVGVDGEQAAATSDRKGKRRRDAISSPMKNRAARDGVDGRGEVETACGPLRTSNLFKICKLVEHRIRNKFLFESKFDWTSRSS